MVIKVPQNFVNYLKKKLKKCKTYDIESKQFELKNNHEFVQNFLSKSSEEIIQFLIELVFKKTFKEKKQSSLDYFFTEEKQIKSHSEIIITPIKNEDNQVTEKLVVDRTFDLIDYEIFESPSNHQNTEKRKLFLESPLEIKKIINHIDNLVEENHRKNSLDSNDSVIQVNYDSDSLNVIPETPIKNLILENINFSPNILDKFSQSPIVLVKPLLLPTNKTPLKYLIKENEYEVLVTPEQRNSEAALKVAKPVKEFEAVTSPKQISSFNTKLQNNSTTNLFELTVINESSCEEKVSINNEEKIEKIIEPIKFNERLSMFLRKDSEPIEENNLLSSERELRKKRTSLNNSISIQALNEKNKSHDLIIINDEVSPKKPKVQAKIQPSKLKRISNIPGVNVNLPRDNLTESEVESFDDSDIDLTYGKEKKNKGNIRKAPLKHVSPVRSMSLGNKHFFLKIKLILYFSSLQLKTISKK